jgi:hypothetical protein
MATDKKPTSFIGTMDDLLRAGRRIMLCTMFVEAKTSASGEYEEINVNMGWNSAAVLGMPPAVKDLIATELRLQADALQSGEIERKTAEAMEDMPRA